MQTNLYLFKLGIDFVIKMILKMRHLLTTLALLIKSDLFCKLEISDLQAILHVDKEILYHDIFLLFYYIKFATYNIMFREYPERIIAKFVTYVNLNNLSFF